MSKLIDSNSVKKICTTQTFYFVLLETILFKHFVLHIIFIEYLSTYFRRMYGYLEWSRGKISTSYCR